MQYLVETYIVAKDDTGIEIQRLTKVEDWTESVNEAIRDGYASHDNINLIIDWIAEEQ